MGGGHRARGAFGACADLALPSGPVTLSPTGGQASASLASVVAAPALATGTM